MIFCKIMQANLVKLNQANLFTVYSPLSNLHAFVL